MMRAFRPAGVPAPATPPTMPMLPPANRPPGGPGRPPRPPRITPSIHEVPAEWEGMGAPSRSPSGSG